MQNTRHKLRRTANACTACRQSKIKCSGNDPCANCQRRSIRCQFSETNTKVLVSERYLRGLQTQIKQLQRSANLKRLRHVSSEREASVDGPNNSSDTGVPSEVESIPLESQIPQISDFTCNIWTSPFPLPTPVIKDTRRPSKRNWIWLAPASPWSFTTRLTLMMTERLGLNSDTGSSEIYLDGDIYPLEWNDLPESAALADLPSLDYALHLFNVAKLHLGQTYRFLDEESFNAHILAFYDAKAEKPAEPRMWFVQFLLILAFGKAFLSRPNGHDPPGSKFFVRAMSHMPKSPSTGRDSLMVIETLALAALYLYSIDHRENAHMHIGQAVRIAQLEGLHTQLPDAELGTKTVTRCQNLWWTLYILDRQVSFAVGLPMITQDCEISTLIRTPRDRSQAMVFNLQVKLSQMLSSILATIYKTEKTQLGAFLESTRNILQAMARLAKEIEEMIPGKFQRMDSVSQETRHIVLLYHQCVIIATRPLLLSVLKERLEKLGRAEENWQGFLALPKSLISIGIKSAIKTLQVLSDENIFLEVFLPFDLEFTYAAALHLTMGNTLFPPDIATQSYSHLAHQVLDEMISRGNKVARLRKSELTRLEGLFQALAERVKQEGLQTLTLPGTVDPESDILGDRGEQYPTTGQNNNPKDLGPLPTPDTHMSNEMDILESIGISSYEFWSIIGQIADADVTGELDPGDGWLGNY
ncbi:Zn(II)2Cys6 transcription factor [Aspergillus sclerotioniger CBS 115572]|uniref:Zn(II)2Cys6 transcription factor n=1 Tax=Aspergillus sclerotioniger CBS 115572 TaxID=1450535 RepID=A0A317WUM4_9EURO|nr:Zn(II)2Cys6 transcription factor [Aspergillus sclerotioniger CBS 115572]PWY87950.1 Zn(II)2Cys6 transcription factor [Aspergillus sclerotioniger CBS 115572]